MVDNKEKQIPCINCIIFPLCNGQMKQTFNSRRTIIEISNKCSLVREYLGIDDFKTGTLHYLVDEMFFLLNFYNSWDTNYEDFTMC